MTRDTLKALRLRYDLNKKQMAEVLDMDTTHYGYVESGKSILTTRTVNRVLHAFSFGREPKEVLEVTDKAIILE